MAEIVQLLVSPVHRYDGRPDPDLPEPPDERCDHIELRAGLGVVGDRYFNRTAHQDAAVTVMAGESLAAWTGGGLQHSRRNVLLSGVDVDAALPGAVLSLDSGDGPVLLLLTRPARPCGWMDARLAPGAWQALRGHGGMRCTPLTDGVLRVGPVQVEWLTRAASEPAGQARRKAKSSTSDETAARRAPISGP